MTPDKKADIIQKFYVTGWLPDGDRVLIRLWADCSEINTFKSTCHICFAKDQHIHFFERWVNTHPQIFPVTLKPACAEVIEDDLRSAKAMLDWGYIQKFPQLVAAFGLPSKTLTGVSPDDLDRVVVTSGFLDLVKCIYRETDERSLIESLEHFFNIPTPKWQRPEITDFKWPEQTATPPRP